MSKVCSNCNVENVDEAKFCRKCGKNKFNTSDIDRNIVVSSTKETINYNKQNEQKRILEDDDTILSVIIHIVLFVVFGYLLHIG